MTISNQKAFDSILSMAQNMLRLAAERAQSLVTPEMIEKELTKLSIMMEDDFALVDRDALVEELIRRSSRTVGENATCRAVKTMSPGLMQKGRRAGPIGSATRNIWRRASPGRPSTPSTSPLTKSFHSSRTRPGKALGIVADWSWATFSRGRQATIPD